MRRIITQKFSFLLYFYQKIRDYRSKIGYFNIAEYSQRGFIFREFCMCKKIYKKVLILCGAFVVTNSEPYSMVGNPDQYQLQGQYGCNANHNMNQPFCQQNMIQFNNNSSIDDCVNRFNNALKEFHEAVGGAPVSVEIDLARMPYIIVAQNKLLNVMADVVFFLLQVRKQEFSQNAKIKNVITKLGNIFGSKESIVGINSTYNSSNMNSDNVINIMYDNIPNTPNRIPYP